MEYNKIGENAGVVWRALNTKKWTNLSDQKILHKSDSLLVISGKKS